MREVTVDGIRLALNEFRGKVAGTSKNLETRVHGGGGGGSTYRGTGYTAPVHISSTTVVHDQLFLVGDDGKEKAFHLQDFDINCREGHFVAVLSAAKSGAKAGEYVVVANGTTDQVSFSDKALRRLLGPSGLLVLLGLVASPIVFMSGCAASLLGRSTGLVGWGLLGALLAVVGPIVWVRTKQAARVREFKSAINVRDLLRS